MKTQAKLIFDLALALDCNPYEIIDCLVGMLLSGEEAGDLKTIISNRDFKD
jgi:hypothetical protein